MRIDEIQEADRSLAGPGRDRPECARTPGFAGQPCPRGRSRWNLYRVRIPVRCGRPANAEHPALPGRALAVHPVRTLRALGWPRRACRRPPGMGAAVAGPRRPAAAASLRPRLQALDSRRAPARTSHALRGAPDASRARHARAVSLVPAPRGQGGCARTSNPSGGQQCEQQSCCSPPAPGWPRSRRLSRRPPAGRPSARSTRTGTCKVSMPSRARARSCATST